MGESSSAPSVPTPCHLGTVYGHSPAVAALGPSRLAKVSHMTYPEEKFSKVPATGHSYCARSLSFAGGGKAMLDSSRPGSQPGLRSCPPLKPD